MRWEVLVTQETQGQKGEYLMSSADHFSRGFDVSLAVIPHSSNLNFCADNLAFDLSRLYCKAALFAG